MIAEGTAADLLDLLHVLLVEDVRHPSMESPAQARARLDPVLTKRGGVVVAAMRWVTVEQVVKEQWRDDPSNLAGAAALAAMM